MTHLRLTNWTRRIELRRGDRLPRCTASIRRLGKDLEMTDDDLEHVLHSEQKPNLAIDCLVGCIMTDDG